MWVLQRKTLAFNPVRKKTALVRRFFDSAARDIAFPRLWALHDEEKGYNIRSAATPFILQCQSFRVIHQQYRVLHGTKEENPSRQPSYALSVNDGKVKITRALKYDESSQSLSWKSEYPMP